MRGLAVAPRGRLGPELGAVGKLLPASDTRCSVFFLACPAYASFKEYKASFVNRRCKVYTEASLMFVQTGTVQDVEGPLGPATLNHKIVKVSLEYVRRKTKVILPALFIIQPIPRLMHVLNTSSDCVLFT